MSFAGPAASAQCQYEVTGEIRANPCPPFGTRPPVFATAMNRHGHVVGYWRDCDDSTEHGFVWKPETGVVVLTRPPGIVGIIPEDINDHGVICGTWAHSGAGYRGFVRWADGTYTELDTLSGAGWGMAHAINNNNVVVGERAVGKSVAPRNAFIWSAEDGFTDLGLMSGESIGRDISDLGTVVGYTGPPVSPTQRAFIYRGDMLTILQPPQGALTTSFGTLNDHDMLGGSCITSFAPQRSVGMLYANGSFELIPPRIGHETAGVLAINELGHVLFASRDTDANITYPYLYVNGEFRDLSSSLVGNPPFSLRAPIDLNDNGKILVDATGGRAVVLTPLNAPETDLTADCRTDVDDLLTLFQFWASSFDPCDFDGNGAVDVFDLFELLGNWG